LPGARLACKLEVLRRHCEEIGRDHDAIEKSVRVNFGVGPNGERAKPAVAASRSLAEMAFSVAHGRVADVSIIHHLEASTPGSSPRSPTSHAPDWPDERRR
jgi:hypothetical protein